MDNNTSGNTSKRLAVKPPLLPKPKFIGGVPIRQSKRFSSQDLKNIKNNNSTVVNTITSQDDDKPQITGNVEIPSEEPTVIVPQLITPDEEKETSKVEEDESYLSDSTFISDVITSDCGSSFINNLQPYDNDDSLDSFNIDETPATSLSLGSWSDRPYDSSIEPSGSKRDSFASVDYDGDSKSSLPGGIDDSPVANNSKENDAYLIAKELITSEQIYIDALRLVVVEFKKYVEDFAQAKYGGNVIPGNDLDKITTSLPQLLRLNEDLLLDLEDRINSWSDLPKIADVIVKKGPFLKLYSTYMKNFESQCAFMDDCCVKYPRFSKALAEFETSPRCRKLTVKHYMLKPVQRIPQYRLLLEKYLTKLDDSTQEYSDAKTALNIVQDVLHHANSTIKFGDNLSKLLRIQSLLGNYEIIKPSREFIKEGELEKLSRKDVQPRFFILLSDCLLYTTYLNSISGMRVKYELSLSGMKINTHSRDNANEFSIITSTRSFTLRARSIEECNEWVNCLKTAIEEHQQKQLSFFNQRMVKSINSEDLNLGKVAPIWIQDKLASMCQICTAGFTVTFRRHHCRCCGRVVCGVCSNNKAPLQYLKFEPERVCEECYDYLFSEYEKPDSQLFEAVKKKLKLGDNEAHHYIRSSFKRFDCGKKTRRFIPQRLKEVTANDSGSLMSGWLHRKGKRGWKRLWFVLKDQVLYIYKASHDVVAHQTLPVLGYTVSQPPREFCDDLDPNLVFSLNHQGQPSVVFSAPNKQSAESWIAALKQATVLK